MGVLDGASESPRRSIVVGVASGFVNTFVISILGAIATHEMALHYGPGEFSVFVTAGAFSGVVANFTDLGLFQVLQRDVARDKTRASRLMSLVFGMRISLSAIILPIAIAIAYVVYRHHSSSLKTAILIALIGLPLTAILQIIFAYYSATARLPRVAMIGIVKSVVFVGSVIIVIANRFSIVDCVAATLASTIVASTMALLLVRSEVQLRFSVDLREWKSMLTETSSVGLSAIIGFFYLNADILLLSVMVSPVQVGYYGIAYAVISVIATVPSLLSVAILPMIVHTAEDALESVVNTAINYLAIAGALAGALGIVIGASVIRLYAGPHYESAVFPLQILCCGQIVLFMTQGLSNISIARGHHRKLFQCSLIGFVLNVIMNLVLIPFYGIRGSAAATALCEVLLAFVMARIIRKDLGVTPHIFRASWKAAIAAAVPCVVLWHWFAQGRASSPSGFLLAIPTVAMFSLVLFLLRGLPSELIPAVRGLFVRGGTDTS